MHKRVSVRNTVRVVSFVLLIFIVLGTSAIIGHVTAKRYKDTIEYEYTRALGELSNHISNLEIALEKGVYANTATQQHAISAKLLSESNLAKSSLGQLPLNDEDTENINKFIAQVGDFASYMSSNVSRGNGITSDEMKNFKSLRDYAKSISNEINGIATRFSYTGAKINNDSSKYKTLSAVAKSMDVPDINSGFHDMNEGFTDYPTLIYDGPFSDHIMQMKPRFLADKEEVTTDFAMQKVASFLGVNKDDVKLVGENASNLSLYDFSCNDISVAVTKKGGYINYVLNPRTVTNENLGFHEAAEKAREYLNNHGISNMQESYYVISNGECTINYVYEENGITCYPDLIKIGVALDNGEIIKFDSTGYIMNHHKRLLQKASISMDEAMNSVSGMLKINNSRTAIIPTSGYNEVLCYEFECTGENNDNVLVYINAQTSMEERILVMLKSDAGILVM